MRITYTISCLIIFLVNISLYSQSKNCEEVLANADNNMFENLTSAYAAEILLNSNSSGDLEKAYELLTKSRESNLQIYNCGNREPMVLDGLSTSSFLLNKFLDAVKYSSELLRENPKHISSLSVRSQAKIKLEDYYGAISDIKKLLTLLDDEDNLNLVEIRYQAYQNLGWSFLTLGQSDRNFDLLRLSIMFYEKALVINSEDGMLYYFRGIAYLLNGESQKGCLSLSQSGELGIEEAYVLIKEHCN